MNYKIIILFTIIVLASCNNEPVKIKETKSEIEGTWQLLSAQKIEGKDTTYTNFTKDMRGIKIINNNHFAFFQHDLSKGQDSITAKFSSGGGRYTLEGDNYTEFLEYCGSRKWEGNNFNFTVLVKNDSLMQTGVEKIASLGVDRIITETYVRIK